jgi:hypothetical protein
MSRRAIVHDLVRQTIPCCHYYCCCFVSIIASYHLIVFLRRTTGELTNELLRCTHGQALIPQYFECLNNGVVPSEHPSFESTMQLRTVLREEV